MHRSRSTTATPTICDGSWANNGARRAHVSAHAAKVAQPAMEIHDGSTPIQHAVLKHARAQAALRASGFAPIAFQARSAEMRAVLRAGRTQQPAVPPSSAYAAPPTANMLL